MSDRRTRKIGEITDADGYPWSVGVDGDMVTIWPGHGKRQLACSTMRLQPYHAGLFAQLFTSACFQAGAQSRALTDAERAELKAAAEEICLADCGSTIHDQACTPQPERTRSQ